MPTDNDNTQTIHTRAQTSSIGVDHYGNGKGTREYFQKGDPTLLEEPLNGMLQTSQFAADVGNRLSQIQSDLAAAWQGDLADQAVAIVALLVTDAHSISDGATAMAQGLGYFLGSPGANGTAATGLFDVRNRALALGDDDDAAAAVIFQQFVDLQNDSMHMFPGDLVYHEPLSGLAGYDGPVVTGPPGGTPPPDPTLYKPPKFTTTAPPAFHIGPGFGHGLGGPAGGGGSGLGGLDDGSALAGLGDGGAGLGAGAGGDAAGLTGGGAGRTSGLGAGAGAGAEGSGGAGAGGMMAPPMGGGRGGGDEQDRQRTTWLNEDEDVWGADDEPDSVIR